MLTRLYLTHFLPVIAIEVSFEYKFEPADNQRTTFKATPKAPHGYLQLVFASKSLLQIAHGANKKLFLTWSVSEVHCKVKGLINRSINLPMDIEI